MKFVENTQRVKGYVRPAAMKVGDIIQGRILGKKPNINNAALLDVRLQLLSSYSFPNSKTGETIAAEEGDQIVINCPTQLTRDLAGLSEGVAVQIRYRGKETTKKGMQVHAYSVAIGQEEDGDEEEVVTKATGTDNSVPAVNTKPKSLLDD